MLKHDLEAKLMDSELELTLGYKLRRILQDVERVEGNQATKEMLYDLVDVVLTVSEQTRELESRVAALYALRRLEREVVVADVEWEQAGK